MGDLTVTKTRFADGLWEGRVDGAARGVPPTIEVTLDLVPVEGARLHPLDGGSYLLRIPVPPAAVGDGIHTFVIRDRTDETILGRFAVLAGEALADTLQGEVELLRAELDLLKKAFRRHCAENS